MNLGKVPLISKEECEDYVDIVSAHGVWVDGVSPSTTYKKEVKHNRECFQDSKVNQPPVVRGVLEILQKAIISNKTIGRQIIPHSLVRSRINLYEDGEFYGVHSDSAFMGNNPEYRTDVSMTLFLTDDYEGGELELLWSNGYAQKVKEPAGTLVYYPSGVMHQVLPVTKGRRVAMVGWFQSHIPNPQERELLSEVTTLCEEMESHENQSYRHRRAISLKHNLFRMFWRNNAG